jgi:hypothetical protein
MKITEIGKKVLYFIITAIIISGPALYCQYPIFNGDSNNYITQSISLIATGTNPIGYSLFVRLVTWNFSLWPVVFFQGLILSIILYLVLQTIFKNDSKLLMRHFFIVITLSIFTGMAWISSQIMSDIFASVSIFCLYLFFLPKTKLSIKIISVIGLFVTFIFHFSFPAMSLVTAVIFVIYVTLKNKKFNRGLYVKLGIVTGIFIVSSVFNKNYNSLFFNEDNPQSARHVILMARIMEAGILDEFLEENCEDNRYTLCNYKGEFPYYPFQFVWEDNSILSKTGDWNQSKEEYNEILLRIFSDPYYLSLFSYKAFISSFKQLFTFNVGLRNFEDNDRDLKSHRLIKKYFSHEEKKFMTSLQHQGINLDLINRSYYLSCGISLIAIMLFLLSRKFNLNSNLGYLTAIIILGILFNAVVNGTFSNVVPRYQARINWMLVLLAIIITQKHLFYVLNIFKNKINAFEIQNK